MKSKQKEREDAIIDVCRSYAYRTKGKWLISFWELADNLNNGWYAHLFLKKDWELIDTECGGDCGIASHNLHKLRRMINWTINRMKGAKTIKQYINDFYEIKMRDDWGA